MTAIWRRRNEASRQQFIDEFLAMGFIEDTPDDDPTTHLRGSISVPRPSLPNPALPVVVQVSPDHPFSPPVVRYAKAPKRLTWHLQPGGVFCLWHRGHHSRLEWASAEAVIERVQKWWAAREDSWPHDAGALDLLYYFKATREMLFTYASSADLDGEVTLTKRGHDWYHWTALNRSGGRDEQFQKRAARKHVAEAIDIGMLDQPVWDWTTIAARMRPQRLTEIEHRIKRKGKGHVLLRYRRPGPDGSREGILGLTVTIKEGHFKIVAIDTAEDNETVLTHRAGPDHPALSTMSVLVVGVGAIGSYIADQLARAGIGRLTLVDHDRLRPGNSTRHLCGPSDINRHKTDAVRDAIHAHTGMDQSRTVSKPKGLSPNLAFELVPEHDIVVDTTADYGVEWILQSIGLDLDVPIIHAGIHRHGGLIRIDRTSRHSNPNAELAPVPAIEGGPTPIQEVGCIDPVSPTPPHVVQAAAAHTTITVIDTLTNRWQLPDSIIHVIQPQPDQPFQAIGAITHQSGS